jgi:hypothetical protein
MKKFNLIISYLILIFLIFKSNYSVFAQKTNTFKHEKLDTVFIHTDSIWGENLNDRQAQALITKWLKHDLTITVSPNPTQSNFYIQTESTHPFLNATNKMVLELYNSTGQLISSQNISANNKLEFDVPKNYSNGFLIYKILLENACRTGKIDIIK